MTTRILAFAAFAALLIASPVLAQTPSVKQCEADKVQWWDEARKDSNAVRKIPFNALTSRAHELQVCVSSVIPQPYLVDANGKIDSVLYSIQLEDRDQYSALCILYLSEATYRLGNFVKANGLDEKFWQFDSGITTKQ